MEKVIHIDSDILGGTPVFWGTRVPVKNLFDYLETGETVDDFLRDFESVQRNQALQVSERNVSYNLNDMLNEITENNIHHSVETGAPKGNEIW